MVCHHTCQTLHVSQRGSTTFTRFHTDAANVMLQGVPIMYKSIAFAVSGFIVKLNIQRNWDYFVGLQTANVTERIYKSIIL